MASTYSTNLALELIGTGEQSGTWGTTTNTNLGTLLEQAVSGYVTQAITDGASANTTITIPNGSTGVARNMFIEMTGALTVSSTSLIVPANKKMYFIFNNTSGGFAVTVKVSGQTGILVPTGKKVVLTCNGTDIVEAHTATVGAVTLGSTLGVTGAATLSSTLDVTGVASFAAGSAAAPAITRTGDLDTGVWFPAANALGLSTSGTNAVYIDSSQNVGIGTSSPAYKLAVAGNQYILNLAATTGTSRVAQLISNTSGQVSIGLESSAGNSLFIGAGAYEGCIGTDVAKNFNIGTNGTVRATIDTSGNLGLGVTPSAWASDTKAVEINIGTALSGYNAGGVAAYALWGNAVVSGGNAVYKITGSAFQQTWDSSSGTVKWNLAASGTAGNAITFTQAMTLDASGNLGIGTSSPSQKLHVQKDQAAYTWARIDNQSSSASAYAGFMLGAFGNSWGLAIGSAAANSNSLTFVLDAAGSPAEKMRLDNAGGLTLGYAASPYRATGGDALMISSPTGTGNQNAIAWSNSRGDVVSARIFNADDGGYGASIVFANRTGVGTTTTERMRLDTSGNFLVGTTSNATYSEKFNITTGSATQVIMNLVATGTSSFGAVKFRNGSGEIGSISYLASSVAYNTTSDQRLKENIQDADSASALIDALQVRQFDWKTDNTHQRYGFVAQELVIVAPEAVHQPTDPEAMMAVDYSKLVPMLIKGMQEQQALIQSLTTRLTALEAN